MIKLVIITAVLLKTIIQRALLYTTKFIFLIVFTKKKKLQF